MSGIRHWLALGLLPLAAAIGTGGGGGTGASAAGNGLRCEIRVREAASGVSLEGLVHAKSAVSGSYRMTVEQSGGGGSSDISQSGEFSARPGEPGSLGTVMLGGDGSFTARLEVTANGMRHACEKHGGEL